MPNFTMGVDLGKAKDYTAVAVVERLVRRTGHVRETYQGTGYLETVDHHHVRHLERPRLGTPYDVIVGRLGELLASPPLAGNTALVVDATGVGAGILDMLRTAYTRGDLGDRWPVPVTITAGQAAHGTNVPKYELVSVVEALLHQDRLVVEPGLAMAEALRRELQAFRAKTTSTGHTSFEAWRETDHDDLVLALCLACWYRHHYGKPRLLLADGAIVDDAYPDVV